MKHALLAILMATFLSACGYKSKIDTNGLVEVCQQELDKTVCECSVRYLKRNMKEEEFIPIAMGAMSGGEAGMEAAIEHLPVEARKTVMDVFQASAAHCKRN